MQDFVHQPLDPCGGRAPAVCGVGLVSGLLLFTANPCGGSPRRTTSIVNATPWTTLCSRNLAKAQQYLKKKYLKAGRTASEQDLSEP